MTGDDFVHQCERLGYVSRAAQANTLGIGERTVDRCRRGAVPPTVRRLLFALWKLQEIEEWARMQRGTDG